MPHAHDKGLLHAPAPLGEQKTQQRGQCARQAVLQGLSRNTPPSSGQAAVIVGERRAVSCRYSLQVTTRRDWKS